jgi:hypothetical protein
MRIIKIKKQSDSNCCCSSSDNSGTYCTPHIQMTYSDKAPWVTGSVSTPSGRVLNVASSLTLADTLGSWKVRWGINRMNYYVNPGLYCTGNPDSNSPVLVTANYKMSFDSLRKELSGLSAWILVLDTKGINVWCAAGKGTFGTKEIIDRIDKVKLSSVVSHRTIILPQLGAPGISAHEVAKHSGFKVVFGPVRARDVKAFIATGLKADREMRTVNFPFIDRLVLTPIELISALKPTLIIFGVLFILNAIGFGHFGFTDLYAFIGAILAGTVLTPILLPWLPGRAFAFKGWILGLLWSLSVNWLSGWPSIPLYGWLGSIAYTLILPAVSAYLAMNFTGCSTYTSFSGVKREMQIAVPLILISTALGIILLIVKSIVLLYI